MRPRLTASDPGRHRPRRILLAAALAAALTSAAAAQEPGEEEQISTLGSARMPDLRGLTADDARRKVSEAGIYADFDLLYRSEAPEYRSRAPGGPAAGEVIDQDPPPGEEVESGVGEFEPVDLVVYSGPRAPGETEDPDRCRRAARELGRELRAVDADVAAGVIDRVGIRPVTDYRLVLNRPALVPQVATVEALPGGRCAAAVDVRVPGDPSAQDLLVALEPRDDRLTFGRDWALTAGQANYFKVRVLDRAGHLLGGAEVRLDASDVAGADVRGRTVAGKTAVKVTPRRAGSFDLVVSATAGNGQTLYGAARIAVRDRSGAERFQTFLGDTFTRGPDGRFKLDFERRPGPADEDEPFCRAFRRIRARPCPAGYAARIALIALGAREPVSAEARLAETVQSTGILVQPGSSTILTRRGPEIAALAPLAGGPSRGPLAGGSLVAVLDRTADLPAGAPVQPSEVARLLKGAQGEGFSPSALFLADRVELGFHAVSVGFPRGDPGKSPLGPPAFAAGAVKLPAGQAGQPAAQPVCDFGTAVLSARAPTFLNLLRTCT